MEYYILKKNLEDDIIYLNNYKSNIEGIVDEFIGGKSLKGKIKNIKSYTDLNDGVLADVIDTTLFTVSERLKDKLLEIESDLEVFPIEIIDNQRIVEGYYAINIINIIDGMNKELSEFTMFEEWGIIDKIQKIVLDEKEIGDKNIFRESNISSRIIVSEKVKEALAGYSGLLFQPLKEYKTPY